jgi:hypothetical protein
MNAAQAAVDPPPPPRPHEARWLARLWRLSRSTLLLGDPGSGKSELLHDGVLPLMGRRQVDRAVRQFGSSGVVVPFPERRVFGGPREPELVLLFGDWQADDPGQALRAQMLRALPAGAGAATLGSASLGECLTLWHRSFGLRFYIALDHFEAVLHGQAGSEALRRFCDELIEVLELPALPAHFLLALDGDAEALLAPLRRRLPDFGDNALRLSAQGAALTPPPEPAPPDDTEFQASLGALMQRIALLSTADTPPAAVPAPSFAAATPPAPWSTPAAAAAASAPTPATAPTDAGAPPAPRTAPAPATRHRRWPALALGGAALALLAAALQPGPASPPAPNLTPASAAVARAVDLPPAGPEPPEAVLRRLAATAGLGWADGVASLQAGQVAVAGYDALLAARAAGGPPLRVLAPLSTETLAFSVDRASPLQRLDQIDGLAVDAGAPGSRSAQTAVAAYRALFGHPPPDAPRGSAPVRLSLGQPVPAGRRLLTLDRGHPSSQRALRRFLPAAGGTLAVMDFLVVRADTAAGPVVAFGSALCAALPALRRDGGAPWQHTQPGRVLPTPWPQHAAAAAAFAGCAPPSPPTLVAGERP